jgi:hypothetical protein
MHATPADFTAHDVSRSNYDNLAEQMCTTMSMSFSVEELPIEPGDRRTGKISGRS